MRKIFNFIVLIQFYLVAVLSYCNVDNFILSFNKDLIKSDAVKVGEENSNKNLVYAKALSGCNLYRTKEMINDFENIIFEVPETYFVVILEYCDNECLKVQYDRFVGYVKSSTVVEATFVPIVKTLSNITLDIKSSSGTQIWKYPTTNSDVYTMVSAGTKGLKYIASVKGSIPYDGENDEWYYVCYIPDQNSTNIYEGYIYSENTVNLSEIVSNLETNPEVISDIQSDEKVLFISSTIKTIVISIITIPIILFFAIILYKIIRKIKKNTNKIKNIENTNTDKFDHDAKIQNIKNIEKFKNMKLVRSRNFQSRFQKFEDDDLL